LRYAKVAQCIFLKELLPRNKVFLVKSFFWWYNIQRLCPRRYNLSFYFHSFL
jgi:hypothetical protein